MALKPPTSEELVEAMGAVLAYGEARRAFRGTQARLNTLLGGNDNKVGVCGEFWAKKFYLRRGYILTHVPPENNEAYDFECEKNGSLIRVSVKVVSDESRNGRQLPLRESRKWDELLIVLLCERMLPHTFGRATREQFDAARAANIIGVTPGVSRSWCGPRGWMSQFGEVISVDGDFFGVP